MKPAPQSFVLWALGDARAQVLRNACKFIESLPLDKTWRITIEPQTKDRTSRQNRYLNGVVYKTVGDALGYERDDISEWFCGEIFGWRERSKPGGRVERVPVRTTTTDEDGRRRVQSREEFANYTERCIRLAIQHGIYVPEPNESDYDTAPAIARAA